LLGYQCRGAKSGSRKAKETPNHSDTRATKA
jgi:hypothetical protein